MIDIKKEGYLRILQNDALKNYLIGGLVYDDEGVKLSCNPLWEQAIYAAQAHNVFNSIKYLPQKNSDIIFAGRRRVCQLPVRTQCL